MSIEIGTPPPAHKPTKGKFVELAELAGTHRGEWVSQTLNDDSVTGAVQGTLRAIAATLGIEVRTKDEVIYVRIPRSMDR